MQQRGEIGQRHRIARFGHGLQNHEAAIQTLNRWSLLGHTFHCSRHLFDLVRSFFSLADNVTLPALRMRCRLLPPPALLPRSDEAADIQSIAALSRCCSSANERCGPTSPARRARKRPSSIPPKGGNSAALPVRTIPPPSPRIRAAKEPPARPRESSPPPPAANARGRRRMPARRHPHAHGVRSHFPNWEERSDSPAPDR